MLPSNRPVTVDAHGNQVHGFVTAIGVANFLGIPFARIDGRFCAAKRLSLVDSGNSIDATNWGPRCPQSRNHGRQRREHLYTGQLPNVAIQESEFDCLNLNIFTPNNVVGSETKLPVMGWIPGGGWVFGDGGQDYGEDAPFGRCQSDML
jgi:carboxylesterase type B